MARPTRRARAAETAGGRGKTNRARATTSRWMEVPRCLW